MFVANLPLQNAEYALCSQPAKRITQKNNSNHICRWYVQILFSLPKPEKQIKTDAAAIPYNEKQQNGLGYIPWVLCLMHIISVHRIGTGLASQSTQCGSKLLVPCTSYK